MVSMITFFMVIMGRHLIGTCNIGNAMNSKKDLGADENGNGKMARFRYFGDDDSNDETK